MERALICPQCKAPLTAHRFAKQAVCNYCGTTVQFEDEVISTMAFREAYEQWNSQLPYAIAATTMLDDRHWVVEKLIAAGGTSDVYTGRLARLPTELVLMKVLRDKKDEIPFENEWKTLLNLQKSGAQGSETFTRLIPQPVLHGTGTYGAFAGRRVSIFRWASGFHYTFEEVHKIYPQGISPQASIWVWRRILEVLTFLHASGIAHGALLPQHLLVQEKEHGVRLVGYGHSGRLTEPLPSELEGYEGYYPEFAKTLPKLTEALDLVMSARCLIYLLGGDPEKVILPSNVPAKLADFIHAVATAGRDDLNGRGAWAIHQDLGALSAQVFGPASYNPIEMPHKSYL